MTVSLGANYSTDGTRFAVCARDADSVELCLFEGAAESRVPMRREGDVHLATVDVPPGQRYGFRATGRWSPAEKLFFDSSKLLVDPYATEIDCGFRYDARLATKGMDTASLVPKALVRNASKIGTLEAPIFQPGGTIYELNVRSFSKRHPDIPPELRGTIAALAHPAVVDHLKRLKVSAVELMPIVAWIDERHLSSIGLRNAWGYNPVVPMAIDPLLAPGGIGELRATTAALRRDGIGVILDLVLNHTGEGDLEGPTLSLRGLDNRCYAHAPDGTLINDAGTGNILDSTDGVARALMLDTMRHFAQLGVDGFRLDLATILARSPAFDSRAPIFAAIANDPILRDRIMIAEPWDVGPGGYQLGQFPTNWLEWNDKYRDDVRRFWRGDPGMNGRLATRLAGSSDVFAGEKTRSVNYVASHDGFTLADVTAYASKHNEANGENNCDGQEENASWNDGAEGVTEDPETIQRRKISQRALLATLFATRGTIQLTAGDEFGRTQFGNNNAYAQDNELTWLDWKNRDTELEQFAQSEAALRYENPALADIRFLTDAEWFDLDGNRMTAEKWHALDSLGFECRFQTQNGASLKIRVDRKAMLVTVQSLVVG